VEAARILSELVAHDHQVDCVRARRVVSEIVAKYAQEFVHGLSPSRAKLIKSYRGGYLPKSGAPSSARCSRASSSVVSTNALELGIDIGSMEAALLIGYPGSMRARAAGRDGGRGSDPSLVVLLPYDSPIDQYMARHPDSSSALAGNAVVDPQTRTSCSRTCAQRPSSCTIARRLSQFGEACGPVLRLLEEDRQVGSRAASSSGAVPIIPAPT
jgi:DEAD/DEAH box helicase domain-containing protein